MQMQPSSARKHELSWLLMPGETEGEIQADPQIFEDEFTTLLQNLFTKESYFEGDSGQSLDIQHYYLDKMYQHGTRTNNYNRHEQKVLEFDTLSCEPLFLVKWKQLSYSQVTWEPLSVLKGENFKRVKEFLN